MRQVDAMWHLLWKAHKTRVGSRLPAPGSRQSGEGGAALVTVLLFMMLVFILITSMLSVTGNEIVIAGLQRDSVRALEQAQTGIQEAIRRIEAGRPYQSGFTSSLIPGLSVDVITHSSGTGAAFVELRAQATVGRSTRRLSALVLQVGNAYPPNVTFAASVSETGSAEISCGDAYAQSFLQYKNYPTNACSPPEPQTITYSGWRASKVAPGPVDPCYNWTDCQDNGPAAEMQRWYPGTRLTVNPTSDLDGDGTREQQEIRNWVNDPGTDVSNCPTTIPESTQKLQDYDSLGDKIGTGLYAGQLTTAVPLLPLFGFDTDGGLAIGAAWPCGFPYKWIRITNLLDENGIPQTIGWWFKAIIFQDWLDRYWYVDTAELEYKKGPDLLANPQYGAIPPFPDFMAFTANYDCKISGGGVLNSLPAACTLPDGSPSTTDLGCKIPEMACSPENTKVIVLEGDWTINGNLGGHGTIIVNGNLVVNGTFDYWGTMVVNGTLQAGTGNVNVHGGMVAIDTLRLIGNITVEGGSTVGGGVPPTGPSNVIGKAWWER